MNAREFYLDNAMKQAEKADGTLDMKAVLQSITRRGLHTAVEVKKMRKILMDALLSYDVKDEEAVHRITNFYGRYLRIGWSREKSFEYIDRAYPRASGTLWARTMLETAEVDWILEPLQSTANPDEESALLDGLGGFHALVSVPYIDIWPMNMVEYIGLKVGDWRFVSVLVKYGCWKGIVDTDENHQSTDFQDIVLYFHHRTAEIERFRFVDSLRLITRFWTLLEEADGRMSCRNVRGFKRIHLIVKTLQAVMLDLEGNENAEGYIKGLQAYFSAVPHPFVSAEEVYEFLTFFLQKEEYRHFIDCMWNKWIELFGHQIYMPRTLQHLCRIKVREEIMRNSQSDVLPNRLKECRFKKQVLPTSLQNFIMGDMSSAAPH